MKKLDLKQMEKLQGGEVDVKCRMGVGLSAMLGGILFGPLGYIAGAAYGYYKSC